jgi:glycerol-3-phosphate O-acyltransferase
MGEQSTGPWDAGRDHRLVFLVDHSTSLERRLVEDWLRASRPTDVQLASEPEVLSLGFRDGRAGAATLGRIAELCSASQAVFFVPARVLWLPKPGKASMREYLRDLLTGAHAPGRLRQLRILRKDPARARPLAGEGATLGALRARYARQLEPGAAVDPAQLAEFITRQALLALERAEYHVRGARYKVPRLVAEEILARPAFRRALAEEAGRLGKPVPDAESEARACLKEMAAIHHTVALDVMAELGRYLYSKGFDPEIQLLPADLDRIRELVRTRPVAFLMTHKSHLDGFLLVTLFYDLDLPPVHTFGGINMNFAGLGTLGRRAGAVFIRRSFNDDPIYKLVFRSYIDYLAGKRFPLLWALEGTRSRTGKLMPPRYGLLNYVVDSYARSGGSDLVLMPVSIVYDQVPEVADYIAEAKGATKRPESASWFMRYVSGLNNPFGRIHVRFGQGVALSDVLGERRESLEVTKLDIQKIAFQLSVDANRVTPVTASALVTFDLLAHGHRALTIDELTSDLRALLNLIRALGLPVTGDVDLGTREVLDRVLSQLVHTGVVARYEDGVEPVYAVPLEASMAAAYYRNTFVHFLVTSAIAELALVHIADFASPDPVAALHEEALRLRDLLKFEFFFDDRESFLETMDRELETRHPGWRRLLESGTAGAHELLDALDPLLAVGSLRPYIEAYWIVADALALDDPQAEFAPKPFMKRCLALGRQRVLQRRVTSEESVSRAYFEPALKLAGSRGLLEGDPGALHEGRVAFAAEMAALGRRITRLAAAADNLRAGIRTRTSMVA